MSLNNATSADIPGVSADATRENTFGDRPTEPVQSTTTAADSSASGDQLQYVLHSDIGVNTLLNRLKQSISSAKDFAIFLKKRSTLEEEHAQGLKKLSRGTLELIRRPENLQGSYAQNYEEITQIHDRLGENGLQFAASLQQMSDELQDQAATSERGRKHWKQSGLNAEKRVQDSEAALDKAKMKYDSVADQYDRARTGDRSSGRFGLKKSAAQQEEDLHRKAEAADTDYAARVQAVQMQRQELISTQRPQAVSALRELISECDSALSLQLQKFASLNEQLLLCNGLCVSPLKSQHEDAGSQPRSLRQIALSIDHERDFREHILSFSNKVGSRATEIKYEKHPALVSPKQTQTPQFTQQQPSSFNGQPGGYANPNQSQRNISAEYNQGYRGPPSGQLSGATPYHSQQQGGLLGPGQSQGPGIGQGPGAFNQHPPGPGAFNQHPPGPNAYNQPQGGPYNNSPGSQLPPMESQAMSGAMPPRTDTGGLGQSSNNNFHGRPQGQNMNANTPISLLQGPNSNQASGTPPGRPLNSYRPDAPMGGSMNNGGYRQNGPSTIPQAGSHPDGPPTGSQFGNRGGPPTGTQFSNRPDGTTGAIGGPSSAPAGQPATSGEIDPYRGPSIYSQDNAPNMASLPGPAASFGQEGPRQSGAAHGHNSSIVPTIFNTSTQRGPSGGPPHSNMPALRPVFGVSLDELFRRDNSAVPMIVYQCVQAVDLFGLDVEGIYRTSGSAPHIMEMKAMFNNDSSQVDFRNPAAFHHDIASVTTLLKHFLRDLPDPLLTTPNYTSFLKAATIEDDVQRRDSLHATINSLPDPNYATLRVLTLHLNRVAEHSNRNRMGRPNLAIVFGPTIMGGGNGAGGELAGEVREAELQARVVETVLANTFQIFDDDD